MPSVTYIGWDAFSGASSLTSVDMPSITHIGGAAFSGASSLTSVDIPAGVTHIGQWAFLGATGLTEIRVAPGNVYYRDIDGVLFDHAATALYTYPAGRDAAHYAVPDSVTTIGEYAFAWATSLTSVDMPGVTSIEWRAFWYAGSLASVDIPASVTYIGSSAFEGASSLTSATIRSRDATFGLWVFRNAHPDFAIHAFVGSTAENYARNNGHNFVPLDGLDIPSGIRASRQNHGRRGRQ